MSKQFTLQEAKKSLMRTGLPYSVRQRILAELRRKGGYDISPAELRRITQRMMRDTKDGITTRQAWRARRGLKKKF